MAKRLIIGLISVLVISSCTVSKNGFVKRHMKQNITLTSIEEQIKIGYETDSAIIYFGQNDAIKQTEKFLSSGFLDSRIQYCLINDLKANLDSLRKIQKDILVVHWRNQKDSTNLKSKDFAEFIDQWILKDLILNRKTEIWNKLSKKFEKRITYHYLKDILGGEECYYTFQNGIEFHRQLIALGE